MSKLRLYSDNPDKWHGYNIYTANEIKKISNSINGVTQDKITEKLIEINKIQNYKLLICL